jgi:beta-lactamase regulating signal transducer with metallopeptidase domain
MTQVIETLVRANLAAGLAVLLVLALRRPLRRRFGPEVAYGLWLAPLLAAAASLLPPRIQVVARAATELPPPPLLHDLLGAGRAGPLLALWLCGVVLGAMALGWGQARFLRRARLGLEGPALVGVIAPRFVTPHGYEDGFTAEERAIIRAHERMHMDRGDTAINALIAALQVLCWFNPLVHWAAHCARHDQELACDAAVVARHPRMRRRYAETLFKTQLAAGALPLGCRWPAPAPHPLEERIALLRQRTPRVRRHLAGTVSVLVLAAGAAAGAWMAKPADLVAEAVAAPGQAPAPTMLFMIYRGA